MNSKNQLLEWHQKNRLPSPIFSTSRLPNSLDHQPLFVSKIRFNGKKYSARGSTKKEAEKKVSQKALQDQETHLVAKKRSHTSQQSSETNFVFETEKALFRKLGRTERIVLIDAENIDLKPSDIQPDTEYIAFVSKNTTKKVIFDLAAEFSNVTLFISIRVGRDAADFMLAVYAGKISMLTHTARIYILTKDHYGEHIETFIPGSEYVCKITDI